MREGSDGTKHLKTKDVSDLNLLEEHLVHASDGSQSTRPECIEVSLLGVLEKQFVRPIPLDWRLPLEMVESTELAYEWAEEMASRPCMEKI